MIGGDQSFSAGDYAGTPIEDVLPVSLLPPGPTAVDETPAQLRLTDAGRRHPVTELATSGAQNETLWSALPRLPGLNTTGPLKGGAQILLQSGEGRPVLVVGEAGRGRVMALLSDSSWYWSFVAAGAQQGPRAYEDVLHSAIRWLVRDPGAHPDAGRRRAPLVRAGGDPPALDVQVRGSGLRCCGGAQISVVASSATNPAPRPMGAALAGPDGNAHVVLPPLPAGAYKATVTAKRADGAVIGEAEDAFVVAPASRELIEAAPRPDILQALAEATKGRVIDASDAPRHPALARPGAGRGGTADQQAGSGQLEGCWWSLPGGRRGMDPAAPLGLRLIATSSSASVRPDREEAGEVRRRTCAAAPPSSPATPAPARPRSSTPGAARSRDPVRRASRAAPRRLSPPGRLPSASTLTSISCDSPVATPSLRRTASFAGGGISKSTPCTSASLSSARFATRPPQKRLSTSKTSWYPRSTAGAPRAKRRRIDAVLGRPLADVPLGERDPYAKYSTCRALYRRARPRTHARLTFAARTLRRSAPACPGPPRVACACARGSRSRR